MPSLREIRTELLEQKAHNMRASDLMHKFFYIATSGDIRRMSEVCDVEEEAQKLREKTK